METLLGKIRRVKSQKRLLSTVLARGRPYFYGLKHLIYDPARSKVKIHCPDYVQPKTEKSELEIVQRIFESYKKMKADQKEVSELYKPTSLWQGKLDTSYASLGDSLASNDISKFHFFLSNFGTWKSYLGIENNILMRENSSSLLRKKYLRNTIFFRQLKIWKWYYKNRKPLSALTYPMHGNQSGVYIDGVFIGAGSFFNEINGDNLSRLLVNNTRPVIAELGAGYGKFAHFILRHFDDFCYIDFDLPEVVCAAAYWLMKSFPKKKALLYGEEAYSPKQHEAYDLIFMPSSEIDSVGERTVDLFLNKNSLGEMGKEAATNYIKCITQATQYFFHMNHDVYRNIYHDKSKGMLAYEYPVPEENFKRLLRYCELGHIIGVGEGFDFNQDIFCYLYERIK